MKLLLVSDVTFDPILREIKKLDRNIEVKNIYLDDINSFFVNPNFYTNGFLFDMVYFHLDGFFNIYDEEHCKRILNNINNFSSVCDVNILLSNHFFSNIRITPFGDQLGYYLNDLINLHSEIEILMDSSKHYFVDVNKVISRIGLSDGYNFKLGHLYQMPYSKRMIHELGTEIFETIRFLTQEEKKVIVLDCDNTLWNGIIGEDGIEDVHCDSNSKGVVFYNFQKHLLALKSQGFLLAIVSKNNEKDVKEAFLQKNMPLKWTDFVSVKVNWEAKSKNIRSIAKELNLGESSFIFIDDNEFEINEVENFTSIDSVYLFKNDFEYLIDLLSKFDFKRKKVLLSDKQKLEQYKIEFERKKSIDSYQSMDNYIASLNLNFDIREDDLGDKSRLSQMTEKTNQFNFNKHAFTESQIEKWVEQGNAIFSLKLSDKFGDYGTVGLIMLEKKGRYLYDISNYLLSCRALGKGVEDVFFQSVIQTVRDRSWKIANIHFNKTDKNVPAENFYKKLNNI
jgi:FkbH-like protein